MLIINYEVIIKYNGNVLRLENELNVDVEIVSPTYAMVTSNGPISFDALLLYPEIEYVISLGEAIICGQFSIVG